MKNNKIELVITMEQSGQIYDQLKHGFQTFKDASSDVFDLLSSTEKKIVQEIHDHPWLFTQMLREFVFITLLYKTTELLNNVKATQSLYKDIEYLIKKHCMDGYNITDNLVQYFKYSLMSEGVRYVLCMIQEDKEILELLDLDENSEEAG